MTKSLSETAVPAPLLDVGDAGDHAVPPVRVPVAGDAVRAQLEQLRRDMGTVRLVIGRKEVRTTDENDQMAMLQRWEHQLDVVLADPKACVWKQEPGGEYWESACGETWTFLDGGPAENKARFCHGCGKPIQAVSVMAQIDADEEADG